MIRFLGVTPIKIDQEKKIFFLADSDFGRAREALDRVTYNAQPAVRSVKGTTAYNILAERIGESTIPVQPRRHPLRKLFTVVANGEELLAENEQDTVLSILTSNIKYTAEAKTKNWRSSSVISNLSHLNALSSAIKQCCARDSMRSLTGILP